MDSPERTALYSLHKEFGARLVTFAGYQMPVQYSKGIKYEHQHTRTQAGLFDISHMGQIRVYAKDAVTELERLVPSDLQNLQLNQQRYTVLTNQEGGIIDDLMISRMPDHLSLVVNASCKAKDFDYLTDELLPECRIEMLADQALLALQGPEAVTILASFVPDINQLAFMQVGKFRINDIYCLISRCGYTGEDGFEIAVASADVETLVRILLDNDTVELVGLGARDSLRLEAGLCLYGHDIDETTTPVEAGLDWVIARKYRDGDANTAVFPGAEKILAQLREGTQTIRMGFRPEGKIPVREGTKIINDTDEQVGRITSGGYGQTIGGPVAMGYVLTQYAAVGTKLSVVIRDRRHTLYVTALPFVGHNYYKNTLLSH